MAQLAKNLPVMQETQVQSLGQQDPLEKEMANYCSILVWWIPWTEETGRLQSMGLQRVGHDWAANIFTFIIQYQPLCYQEHWWYSPSANCPRSFLSSCWHTLCSLIPFSNSPDGFWLICQKSFHCPALPTRLKIKLTPAHTMTLSLQLLPGQYQS